MRIRLFQLGTTIVAALSALFTTFKASASAAPGITTQPQSQTNFFGSNIKFTVTASGQAPLSYQWFLNDASLTDSRHVTGSTTATLTLNSIVANDAGDYQVLISNTHGSVLSSSASLTVLVPAMITSPPTNQSVLLNSNVTFSTVATGTAPLNYQWYFNGSPLTDGGRVSGSVTGNLNISNVQTNDTGSYLLVVTNNYGSSTSAVATLIVLIPPTVITPVSNDSVVAGGTAFFSVTIFSSEPVNYQWYLNDVPLTDGGRVSGANSPNLTISNVQSNDAGGIMLIATNSLGEALTEAGLTVFIPAGIAVQPTNQSALLNTNVLFTATATGQGVLYYQWYFNGTLIAGSDSFTQNGLVTLYLQNVSTSQAGSYQFVVTNNYGSATSAVATLTVLSPATIVSQPLNQYVLPGGNAVFSVTASGDAPLTYEWLFNGAPLSDGSRVSGSASNQLTIQSVQASDLGAYQVVVSNAWNTVTSSVANLTFATARYVNANNPSPVAPYTNWVTAAQVIQNAIDAANVGDWIIVTNGSYVTGGRVANTNDFRSSRVVITNQVTVVSVNGPLVTTILGDVSPGINYYGTRCAWLGGGAKLSGFTVESGGNYYGLYGNGPYDNEGGGILCLPGAVVSDCIITGNAGVAYGGGVFGGTVIDCLVSGNVATGGEGGGAYLCTLINCTVVGNQDNYGGGVGFSTVENSIVYFNTATVDLSESNYWLTSFTNSCTTPDPGGVANITNDPVFVNYSGGNYHLQFDSPCIDTGSNAFVNVTNDLDGRPRIVDGVVDMGAYEYEHAPWFQLSPTNQIIPAGGNLVLNSFALGDPTIVYQWWMNGIPLTDGGRIVGSESNLLTIAASQTNDSGSYWVTASNSFGMATSAVAAVTVQLPVAITSEPASVTTLVSNTVKFAVGAIGFAPPNYQWYYNGTALTNGGRISGATSMTLTISSVQTNDNGMYQAIVANNYGSVTSAVATLTALFPAQITSQPVSQVALLGGNATFTVAAAGSGPLDYQWYFNGSPLTDGGGISGSVTPVLNISNVQSSDAGGYVVIVNNLLSSAKSLMASLTPQAALAPSIRYVALTSTNPSPPYLDWSTAATNIQDAIDAAVAGDSVVVSNGTYSFGGRAVYGTVTNRLVVNKAIAVQSVNGPSSTIVQGGMNSPLTGQRPGARCAYLTNGAVLMGFTLTNGGSSLSGDPIRELSGGGLWCESPGAIVSNCIIANSVAQAYGGGAFGGTLINCILITNSATGGGGAASNVLFNCTLSRNFIRDTYGIQRAGAGAYGCTVSNSLLVSNTGTDSYGGGAVFSVVTSCTISNNHADYGGGVSSGIAINSVISGNVTTFFGGGAYSNALNNCVLINNSAEYGGGAYRGTLVSCAVSNNTASTSGGGVAFGLANSSLISSNRAGNGGGAYSNVMNNCVVQNNSATYGGGVYSNVLNNCILQNNVAAFGGGAYNSALANCTVVSNVVTYAPACPVGGGIYGGSAMNSIVYYNQSECQGSNFYFPNNGVMNYCCTTPLPTNSVGNITNEPAFVNLVSEDFHLQSTSPCINSGNNAYVTSSNDFDGNPRIVGGTVDIGAHEFQSPTSIISYAWLEQYGLPTDGSADFVDTDGTGMNNWQKWIAGLSPLDPTSILAMQTPQTSISPAGITVTWLSVSNRTYYLQQATNLAVQPAFSTIQSNIIGQAGTTSFTDTTATNGGPYFYRVGVQH